MATITLDYNIRNAQAKKTLDYILSLGFFKIKPDRKPRRKKTADKRKLNLEQAKDPFAEVFGIWADRDIDAKELRRKAWGREG